MHECPRFNLFTICKGVGKPLEEAFEIINNELVKKYPAYIRPWSSRKFMLFNGGGAMGQMYVLIN